MENGGSRARTRVRTLMPAACPGGAKRSHAARYPAKPRNTGSVHTHEPSDQVPYAKRMKVMAPATLNERKRQTASPTPRQMASRERFWKITSESGLVVILPRITTTARGTKRL